MGLLIDEIEATGLRREALARHWDRLYTIQADQAGFVWSREPSDFVADLVPQLEAQGYRSVVDLGCGDGRNLVPFARAGFSVTGVDVSGEALRRARANLEPIAGVGSHYIHSEVGDLTGDRLYDVVISTKVFKHIWDGEAALDRLLALVAPGGTFILELATRSDSSREKCLAEGRRVTGECFELDNGTPYRFYSQDEVRDMFGDGVDVETSRVEYWDEPHEGLSSKRHKHDSWVLIGGPRLAAHRTSATGC